MSRLLPIAEQLLMMGALGSSVANRPQQKVTQMIYGAAGILAIVSLICLAAAFSYWLRQQFAPDVAALIAGLSVLGVSALIAAAGYAYSVLRRNRVEVIADEMKNKILSVIETAADEMEDPIRDHPKSSVALATLAGYITGNRMM